MGPRCTQYGLLEEKCINVGERQEKKMKCCITKHVTGVRSSSWEAVLSVETSQTAANRGQDGDCDNTERLQVVCIKGLHCQPLSSVRPKLCRVLFSSRDNAGVISTTSARPQSLEAICWPDTPVLSQPIDSVNTEGKKRCPIVLQRLTGWLEIITPCGSESSFLRPLNGHWWSYQAIRRMWLQLFTHKYPPLTKETGDPGALQHRGVVFSTTVAQHLCQHVDCRRDCVYSAAVGTNNCNQPACCFT